MEGILGNNKSLNDIKGLKKLCDSSDLQMTSSLISATSSLTSPVDSGVQLLDSESDILSVMSMSGIDSNLLSETKEIDPSSTKIADKVKQEILTNIQENIMTKSDIANQNITPCNNLVYSSSAPNIDYKTIDEKFDEKQDIDKTIADSSDVLGTDLHVSVSEEVKEELQNEMPLEPISVDNIQPDEQIVFRRQRKKKSSKSDTPKKRVSFHEDILNSTRIDDIHINHGFITHQPDISMSFFPWDSLKKKDVVKGRYSWAAEGDTPYYESNIPERGTQSELYVTRNFSTSSSSTNSFDSSSSSNSLCDPNSPKNTPQRSSENSISSNSDNSNSEISPNPKPKLPRSSCLKKRPRSTYIETQIVEENIGKNRQRKSESNLLDSNIFGSLKNMFTIPLAERGVPEGSEDIPINLSDQNLSSKRESFSKRDSWVCKSQDRDEKITELPRKVNNVIIEPPKNKLKLVPSDEFYENVPQNAIVCDSTVYEHKGISYSYEYDKFQKSFEQEVCTKKPKSSTVYQILLRELNFFKKREKEISENNLQSLCQTSTPIKENINQKSSNSQASDWSSETTESISEIFEGSSKHLASPKHKKANHYTNQNFKFDKINNATKNGYIADLKENNLDIEVYSIKNGEGSKNGSDFNNGPLDTNGALNLNGSLNPNGPSKRNSLLNLDDSGFNPLANFSNETGFKNSGGTFENYDTNTKVLGDSSFNKKSKSNDNDSFFDRKNSECTSEVLKSLKLPSDEPFLKSDDILKYFPRGSMTSKTSLINRFLKNVTMKKLLDAKLAKKRKASLNKCMTLYIKGVKPNVKLSNDLDMEIEEEILQNRVKKISKVEMLGSNFVIRVKREVFNDPTEKLCHVFKVRSIYTSTGETRPLIIFLSNLTLYVTGFKPNHSFVNHFILPYVELDTILVGPDAHIIYFSNALNSFRKQEYMVMTGSSQITSEIIGNLEMIIRKNNLRYKLQLPAIRHLTMRDMICLRSNICKQAAVEKDEEYFQYSIINMQEINCDVTITPLGPVKEGPLMFKSTPDSRWETGYFILKGGVLYMLSSPSNRLPMRALPLSGGACLGAHRTPMSKRPHTFELLLTNGALQLAAPDEYVASDWLQLLVQAASGLYSSDYNSTQSCTLMLTSSHLLTIRESFPVGRFNHNSNETQMLTCASISDIMSIRIPLAEQSWCILEFACREVHETSGDLVIYFATNTELERFLSNLEMLWSYNNTEGDSFPLNTISENESINKRCVDAYRSLQTAWSAIGCNLD